MISWGLKTRSQQPIGLDVGHNSIKMIQLAVKDEHMDVLAANRAEISPDINGDVEARRSFIVSAIKRMLAEGNFRGRNVVSCLPNNELKITSLRLAETDKDRIEQVLRKEVSQRFGLDPEVDSINYLVAGNVRHGDEVKNEVILFAAANEAVKCHIEMLEEAELQPVAIDPAPCALFRSFRRSLRRHEDMERTAIFVDVGSYCTTVVFGRREEVAFVKQIPIGGLRFNEELASKLNITTDEAQTLRESLQQERLVEAREEREERDGQGGRRDRPGRGRLDASTRQVMVDAVGAVAEQLAREVSLCLRYYTVTFRGKRLDRAVFAGGEAYEEILLNALRRQLTVKIEVAQPFRGLNLTHVDLDDKGRGLFCDWTVAVGLGLKGWEEDSGES